MGGVTHSRLALAKSATNIKYNYSTTVNFAFEKPDLDAVHGLLDSRFAFVELLLGTAGV